MTMDELGGVVNSVYFGNTVGAWIAALVQFVVWFTVLPLARAFIASRLRKRAEAHPGGTLLVLRALVDATTGLFTFAVAAYLALRWLNTTERFDDVVDVVLLVILWSQVALWGSAAVRHLMETRRGGRLAAAQGAASLNLLRFVSLVAVWSVAFLMLLANLGIEIMPLVAGLGIGGVAVALAVQNVLGDLLASLSIALDKPFKVGDFLIVGAEMGTVEHIGIKSTRLRSLSGELIVTSNGDLLQSRLHNYGLLYERRVTVKLGIVYETKEELVREVPGILVQAIRSQDKVRFDRAHFVSFGAYALEYEAVYFVLSADYNLHMDIQQAINFRILEEFARRGIAFAYPTSTFHVYVPPERGAARANG